MNELKDKVALVTGASRGIGLAIARRFAAEGASVVMCASRLGAHGSLPGTLEGVVASINEAGGRAPRILPISRHAVLSSLVQVNLSGLSIFWSITPPDRR